MNGMKTPRGIRNCNPGNLRLSKDRWKGLRPVQTDKEFFQFEEMKWGYRALMRTLQNYRRVHGCRTVADFIRRWAPDKENNTPAYIKSVCSRMGVSGAYVPDVENRATMCAFAAAISLHENGVNVCMEEVQDGWNLL